MKKLILIAAAVLPMYGQTVLTYGDVAFQALGNPVLQGVRVLDEGFSNRVVKNKPFSATEERHFVQTLGDGTRIENMQTNRLYRDADGRTRVEEMNGTVSIYDPATNQRIELDPATKTAHRGRGGAFVTLNNQLNNLNTQLYNLNTQLNNLNGAYGYGYSTGVTPFRANSSNMQGVMSETTENLGTQSVNGVSASGVRTTMVIPKGQIGNNKDIKVMTERWSSNDLQMLVKSVNSDPRFGDTTYQLTKITQSAPDPALFQVPGDYTVTEDPLPSALNRLTTAAKAARGGGRAASPAQPGPKQPQ